ncbi:hypothetical protein HPB47_000455 [Ixodes persulcatus]|uniref:Uncharacterized protein n=1 Tax=Ixodes persulcatus TaxID=34615 RepID=A0AC60PRS1_IXOPE|nr:hypothetical protein HPB47_000455 [Ixodes persulcatus]
MRLERVKRKLTLQHPGILGSVPTSARLNLDKQRTGVRRPSVMFCASLSKTHDCRHPEAPDKVLPIRRESPMENPEKDEHGSADGACGGRLETPEGSRRQRNAAWRGTWERGCSAQALRGFLRRGKRAEKQEDAGAAGN